MAMSRRRRGRPAGSVPHLRKPLGLFSTGRIRVWPGAGLWARKAQRGTPMGLPSVDQLRVKIFADGAALKDMKQAAAQLLVKGFTTNPTLMRQAGVSDYKAFALEVLKLIP